MKSVEKNFNDRLNILCYHTIADDKSGIIIESNFLVFLG